MFTLKNTIKVGDWDIVNNSLLAIQENQINEFDLLGNYLKAVCQLDTYWGVKFYTAFFHIFTMYLENTVVDYAGKILFKKDDFSFYHFYNSNEYIGFDRKIKKVVNSDGKEIFNKKMSKKLFYNNLIIFTQRYDKDINLINLTHPEQPLWQFNLPQLGTFRLAGDEYTYDVVRFIDVWNNLLLVQLKNARLIALDIKTGELKQDLPINQTNPLKSPLFYDQYTKMHLVEDKIIWLSNQTLIHIDLHTFKAEIIKEYYTKPRDNQWRFMHNTYFEGKIYFTADYAWQYVTPSYVGVMDANTGDVLWSQQLKNTGGLPEAPKVTKDKLYIRTSTAMLHIFEKTNNATT